MKALGKIGDIHVAYQQEKTSERDGSKYWAERYTIYMEVGEDIHMVDSGFLHVNGQGGGLAILEKKGIVIGAVGEMTIRYGFRDWNNKRFPECTLVRFDALVAKSSQVPANASTEATKPADVAAEFAEAAEEQNQTAKAEEDGTSDLPF